MAAWAPKQDALSWEQAGGAAANVEAATCVLDRLKATAVTTLLIEGTAGGVGTVAIHLAAARGMAVIGTASARNQEFVATPTTYGPGLGERVTALALDGVDVVLDCTGSGSLLDLGASLVRRSEERLPSCLSRSAIAAASLAGSCSASSPSGLTALCTASSADCNWSRCSVASVACWAATSCCSVAGSAAGGAGGVPRSVSGGFEPCSPAGAGGALGSPPSPSRP